MVDFRRSGHICYPKSVSFIKFLMGFCIIVYDDILDTIWTTDKKLLLCKLSKSGRVDKTGFPRKQYHDGKLVEITFAPPKMCNI